MSAAKSSAKKVKRGKGLDQKVVAKALEKVRFAQTYPPLTGAESRALLQLHKLALIASKGVKEDEE